ncbi:MAG: NAD(P)H-dependent oxidoreductase [Candidatus Krumholzibacteria bacterium]|jgi:NAD(P)H dehydrogenase (quinone)|nr:NAD(P)H-dependent oxidoreductase [Candidatus Krumholzibacteria bacterium]
MKVYIVFAHPSRKSFTGEVLDSFVRGLAEAGHCCEIGDLYVMNFRSDMDPGQYERETGMDPSAPVPADVLAEQEKIGRSDALVLVYPLWWSDCPAKLKGWFDRVWSLGYAYTYENGAHAAPAIKAPKALVICTAGHTEEHLEETGIAESMRRVMLQDRLLGVGFGSARLEILGGMVLGDPSRRRLNLERAYRLGRAGL